MNNGEVYIMENILIVVDMQNDFVDGALGTPEAVEILDRVAEKIKGYDGYIFVTLDTHFENYLETREGRALPVPHCIKETEGWRLHPRIAAALQGKAHILVEKHTFGAIDLPTCIHRAVGSAECAMELVGLCTDICVVSNALLLRASFPEAQISVDASCCAGVTPAAHKAALETMESCQIRVIGA